MHRILKKSITKNITLAGPKQGDTMSNKTNKLATLPIGKLVLTMTLPVIFSQVINLLYTMLDKAYLGRIPEYGSLALAGVGVTLPIIVMISAFSALIGMGGAPRAAIKLGEGDIEGANKTVSNSFVLLIIMSITLTAILYIFKVPILKIFGATAATLPFADDYLSIYLIATIFIQITLGLNSFIIAGGQASVAMKTVLIGAVINIVLDPIFIFGLNMGVKGAALATVIAQGATTLWVLIFLFGPKSTLKIKKEYFKLDKKIILPVLLLGLSPFIMQATESLVQVVLNSSLKAYGGELTDTLIGTLTIMLTLMQFMIFPIIGLTQGAQPIISYNYGAGNLDRVKKTFKTILIIALSYTIICFIAMLLFPNALASLFTTDPALISSAVKYMPLFLGGVFILGAQFTCQSTLVSLGKAKASLILAIIKKMVILIPLVIILPKFLGFKGVYAAQPIADILAGVITILVFISTTRTIFKTTKKIGE